ncbi:MAG: hypothetical protein ACJAZO_003775 [Myxococcota bacterium]|jgi:hypothetical protein
MLILATLMSAFAADGADVMAHQGRLLDVLGNPMEGDASLTFAIYQDEDAISPAWSEVRPVNLTNGYYSTLLGETLNFPPPLFDDPSLWLSISVGGQELGPRQVLSAGVYGGGRQLSTGYPTEPQLSMGFEPGNYDAYQFLTFPFTYDSVPVVIATIDETMNESGPSWLRQIDKRRDRSGFYNNANLEGIHWLAIEPGIHTIDGKTVMAGHQSPAANGGTVTFPDTFSQAPVIFLNTVTLDNSGAVTARVINSVGNTSFQYYTDASGDALDWVAFEPGEYTVGRYHFYVGTTGPASNNRTFSWPVAFANTPNGVLTIHDTNNSGGVYTRWHEIGDTSGRFYIDGTSEVLNYMVFEDLER